MLRNQRLRMNNIDFLTADRKEIDNALELAMGYADDWFTADIMMCLFAKDNEEQRRRISAFDIPYRANQLIAGLFCDGPVSRETGESSDDDHPLLVPETLEEQEECKSSYKPAVRFIKILKGLARNARVPLSVEQLDRMWLCYNIIVDSQINIDKRRSLINVKYVIYKMADLIGGDFEKIRSVIKLPKAARLAKWDERWEKIVENIEWIEFITT